MAKTTLQKIIEDPEYLAIVKLFTEKRKAARIHQRDMEIATRTGGGRVSNFEALLYKPTLLTFVKWCKSAGIHIKLINTVGPKTASRSELKKASDPGNIIDDIKKEKRLKKINSK